MSLVIVGLSSPSTAIASSLFVPAAGSADSAAAGATIAEPLTPIGAQFANPAGLAGFTEGQMGAGFGLAYGRGVVTADEPAGYHAENEVLVPFFDSFLALPYDRWTFGLGTMGTSGARFDYGPRPNLGVNDGFFSESGIIGVPLTAAYRVSDKLWLGGQLIALHGSTHLRYTQQTAEYPDAPTPFRFTVEGFGVQGMIGATWKPLADWSFGASLKPPGRIWADGDSRLGNGKQGVDLELEAPLEAGLGITHALTEKWKASYGVHFSDTSVLATSYIRFRKTPSVNVRFLTDARDEWRHSISLEYAWSDAITLLGGFAKANGIVGTKGVSPMTYDTKDLRLSTGMRWKGEKWMIDGAFGFIFAADQHISKEDALIFPGKYDEKPAYLLMVTVTKKF